MILSTTLTICMEFGAPDIGALHVVVLIEMPV